MPDLTPERLAAIRERHGMATDGPWWFDESDTCWRLHGVMGRIPPLSRDGFFPEQVMNKQILKAPKNGTPYAEYWPGEADGAFISHAWEDVRELLAEVERLRAGIVALDRLDRAAIGDWEREVDRLRAELAEMKSAAADWAGRLMAQKDRADRSANRTRGLMRTAIRRIGELGQLRDAIADSDPIRAERLAFAIEEIRALFKREADGGEAP